MGTARVLIADGRPAIRQWLGRALRPVGVVVRAAPSGRSALQAIVRHGPFDLVIANTNMRDPSGLELVGKARDLGGLMPFILTADRGDEALRTTVGELGDAVLLDMPFDEVRLQFLVARLVLEGAVADDVTGSGTT